MVFRRVKDLVVSPGHSTDRHEYLVFQAGDADMGEVTPHDSASVVVLQFDPSLSE